MKGMEKISQAVLDKVRAEADSLIKDAEVQAEQELAQAKERWAARQEEETAKILQQAGEEAARIEAQALVKARQELSRVKADLVSGMVDRVKQRLSEFSDDGGSLIGLIKESIDRLRASKVKIYVSPQQVSVVQRLLEKDKELAGKVAEVKGRPGTGGVIVEDASGEVRIDNTYETRLEMLLPKLLPEIDKELFQGS
ncbi:MAG: V-type ATP synthase subunit E [Dehalococcoidales bacterium]|nr:V-type ATP synthase subunit E [Dehalococcoidales bacterium]